MIHFKFTSTLLLFLTYSFLVSAQDIQFLEVENLPEARSALTSANDGANIYVVNGFGPDEQFTSDIFQYNVVDNSWSTLTSSSIAKRYASAAVVGDYLYVFSGVVANDFVNSQVEKIDLISGEIELLSDNPQATRAGGVATWNNKIYSFGGTISPNSYSNKLYEFDPIDDSWTELSEMPYAGETKGEIVNGKLYVIGGYNGDVSDRIDVYDLESDTWESNFTMPINLSAHATALIGTRIYLIGDFINLTSVAYFDTADDSFNILSNNLVERRHGAAEGVGGSLFAIGGNTISNIQSSISSVQKAELITSTDEFTKHELVEAHPNPTINNLYFNEQFDLLQVFNSKGEQVKKYQNTTDIEVADLASGVYMLKGYRGKRIFQSKFIKI